MPALRGLFDLALDPFLRKLCLRLYRPLECVCAYMDDIAMALADLFAEFPGVLGDFEIFRKAAGPSVNISKCVTIPLWSGDLLAITLQIHSSIPMAVGIAVARSAKLLGVFIGPDAHGESLTAPLRGLTQRVHQRAAVPPRLRA